MATLICQDENSLDRDIRDFRKEQYILRNKVHWHEKVILPPEDLSSLDLQNFRMSGLCKNSTLQPMPLFINNKPVKRNWEVILPPDDISSFDLTLHRQNGCQNQNPLQPVPQTLGNSQT